MNDKQRKQLLALTTELALLVTEINTESPQTADSISQQLDQDFLAADQALNKAAQGS